MDKLQMTSIKSFFKFTFATTHSLALTTPEQQFTFTDYFKSLLPSGQFEFSVDYTRWVTHILDVLVYYVWCYPFCPHDVRCLELFVCFCVLVFVLYLMLFCYLFIFRTKFLFDNWIARQIVQFLSLSKINDINYFLHDSISGKTCKFNKKNGLIKHSLNLQY